MPALSRRLNARNIELYPHTRGESVGVRTVTGEVKFFPWLGFIDLDVAKAIKNAKPVKLEVARYSDNAGGWATEWKELQSGDFVQGCLTLEGVYGVVATGVRIVRD